MPRSAWLSVVTEYLWHAAPPPLEAFDCEKCNMRVKKMSAPIQQGLLLDANVSGKNENMRVKNMIYVYACMYTYTGYCVYGV